MTRFTIEVANKTIGVSTLFDQTKQYCRDYLTEAETDFDIATSMEDIAYEQKKSIREFALEGKLHPNFPDHYYEITAVQRKIAERMFEFDTLLFHGSVVALDGEAFLFTAKSGTGKSTHTRLWRQVFGSRAVTINDDKPFLTMDQHTVTVHGSPWNGKHRIGSNTSAPLKAICILERGAENQISEISAKEALPMLLQQSNRPMRMAMMNKYLELIDRLAQHVQFYRLFCTMDPQAAMVAYEGMSSKGKEEKR